MKEVWKFFKYSMFLLIGSISLFLISSIAFGFSWVFLVVLMLVTMFSWGFLFIKSIKNIMKGFEKTPTAKYYDDNLRDAKRKIKQIRSIITKMPSSKGKLFYKTYDYMKQIYLVVEKSPNKYTQARPFFNEDIDNTMKIIENYSYLLQQPTKSKEMKDAIVHTEEMIRNLEKNYEKTIHSLATKDVVSLDMELNYLKNKIEDPTKK